MGYSYDFGYSGYDGVGSAVAVLNVIYWIVVIGYGIFQYVFASLSVYTIAKRRRIHHPWMAWVPVVNDFLLGCVSDQYQYVVKGKNKAKRRVLLILDLLGLLAGVFILGQVMVVADRVMTSAMLGSGEAAIVQTVIRALPGVLAAAVIVAGLSIGKAVVRYIALYDLYTSCDPKNNVMFLVLGIFFGVMEPIFLFLCRNKDEGMPPRRETCTPPQYQPTPEPERWHQPEEPQEPWMRNEE